MKITTANWTRRRVVLLVGCIGLTALALILLAFTADATPAPARRLFGLWQTRYVVLAGGLFFTAAGFLAAATSRRMLLAFVAIVVSAATTLALLEVMGVLGLVSWPALLAPQVSTLGTQRVPNLDVAGITYQDTASRWGLPSDPIPFRYRTDRYGFRNDIDRVNGDIYLLGDSVLVAALVPFPETVTARLEATIRRPVMQVALIGKSPQEEQQLFRDTKLNVRERLVIQFIFEGNDMSDSRHFRERGTEPAPMTLKERTLTHQIVIALQKLTQPISGLATLRSCKINDQTYTFLWTRESFTGLEEEATAISDSLARFATEVREAGGEFSIVFVPSKLRVLGPLCRFPAVSEISDIMVHLSPLRDHLHAWSVRSGIRMLDLTEPLQSAAREGNIPWFWGDTHWNAEGHGVAAEALAKWEPVRMLRVH